jgi:hypothetical protein
MILPVRGPGPEGRPAAAARQLPPAPGRVRDGRRGHTAKFIPAFKINLPLEFEVKGFTGKPSKLPGSGCVRPVRGAPTRQAARAQFRVARARPARRRDRPARRRARAAVRRGMRSESLTACATTVFRVRA